MKLARHDEMFFNISITSPMSCPSFTHLAWFPFGILLELSWPRRESALLKAWSLKQFSLVCPCTPQWWQKCFTWDPLWLFGNDFPFSLVLHKWFSLQQQGSQPWASPLWAFLNFWPTWTSLPSWVHCLSFLHRYSLDRSCHFKVFKKRAHCQVSWWKCAPLWHLLELFQVQGTWF